MADRSGGEREMVFCHQCQNEWFRDTHGLQCPECQSEIVEIIDAGHDPRQTNDDPAEVSPIPHPLNPLRDHHPWQHPGAPDPEEDDISRTHWPSPNSGMHFAQIQFRSSSSPRPGQRPGNVPPDPFGTLFSTLLAAPQPQSGRPMNHRVGTDIPSIQHSPLFPGSNPRSPLQEGSSRHPGFTRTYHTTLHYPPGPHSPHLQEFGNEDLSGILATLIQQMHGVMQAPNSEGRPNAAMGPLAIFQQLINPANARHGDVVYTQEALDRVISQLMEQHSSSSAPGPAAESAIMALPRVKIDDSKLDSNGKAECSICMDGLEVGSEVAELPCKHWFHSECAAAWLREHDTCPQCRRGIMPKNGDGSTARTPGQVPMNMQAPWGPGEYFGGAGHSRGGAEESGGIRNQEGSGSQRNPYRVSQSPTTGPSSPQSRRPEAGSRRQSEQSPPGDQHSSGGGGGGGGGGISGWMGRHFGGRGGSA